MNELTDERLAELRTIAEETRVRRIAPFDPPTMLALLAEVERLRVALRANDDARDNLERRLAVVLAEHSEHVHTLGCELAFGPCWKEDGCDGCGDDYPCPTVKAARGEA